jgi:lipopolysaccharide biosynthesis glycosyltransferase
MADDNMFAVTIGIGSYTETAVLSGARVGSMTGLDVHIIDEAMASAIGTQSPSFVKLLLPRIVPRRESFLYFDADIVMLRKWDLSQYNDEPNLVAVHDEFVDQYDNDTDIPRENYFNGGMFIAHPDRHDHIFELARIIWENSAGSLDMADQSALNRAAVLLGSPVRMIDEKYNFLRYHLRHESRQGAVMAHYTPYGRRLAHEHLIKLSRTVP